MILREIVHEYSEQILNTYQKETQAGRSEEQALEICLEDLLKKKSEISVLFSEHAENYLISFGLEVINNFINRNRNALKKQIGCTDEEIYLYLITTASGAYGLLMTWLINDMKQTPKEIIAILKNLFSIHSFRLS